MKIQSLQVCVPGKCVNKCKFCVSHMRKSEYNNVLSSSENKDWNYNLDAMKDRLDFARDNGCNTMMITGECEPQFNKDFLEILASRNKALDKPFRNIEIQTTGVGLTDDILRFLKYNVGVKTISVSISDLWDSKNNAEICKMPIKLYIVLDDLCKQIKQFDFNLRLSINLLDNFENKLLDTCQSDNIDYDALRDNIITNIFNRCIELGANQVTFRKMYASDNDLEASIWTREHLPKLNWSNILNNYVMKYGTPLEMLEFGVVRYAVHGMSIVINNDCMSKSKDVTDSLRYLILRPDCKLYSAWDDKGSIIF